MTIEIDPLGTTHSDLDDAFRRHAFERLRRAGTLVVVSEMVETSPSGSQSAERTLDTLIQRGMAIVEDDELVAIDGLSVKPTQHRITLGAARRPREIPSRCEGANPGQGTSYICARATWGFASPPDHRWKL